MDTDELIKRLNEFREKMIKEQGDYRPSSPLFTCLGNTAKNCQKDIEQINRMVKEYKDANYD